MSRYTAQERDAFASRLTMAINATGKTREELAQATGLSAGMVNYWRDPDRDPPKPTTVFAIEDALGLPPGELSSILGYQRLAEASYPPCTIERALANDPALTPDQREALLTTYSMFTRLSR